MLDKFQYVSFMLLAGKAKRDEKGATATEYGLLVAFIALGIILAVTAFGEALDGFFDGLAGEVGEWTEKIPGT